METTFRVTGLALAGTVCALALKQHRPELALILALTAACGVLWWAAEAAGEALNFLRELAETAGMQEELLQPLLKTIGIALVTRLAGELCRDAGEGGIASALDLAGGVMTVCVSVPLMRAALDGLRDLL